MEIVFAVVGALVVLVFIVGTLIGRRLPVAHVASRFATFAAPPERVWELITDPAFMRSRGVGVLTVLRRRLDATGQ